MLEVLGYIGINAATQLNRGEEKEAQPASTLLIHTSTCLLSQQYEEPTHLLRGFRKKNIRTSRCYPLVRACPFYSDTTGGVQHWRGRYVPEVLWSGKACIWAPRSITAVNPSYGSRLANRDLYPEPGYQASRGGGGPKKPPSSLQNKK